MQEWTAGTLRAYPGAPLAVAPGQFAAGDGAGAAAPRTLRGASFATPGRLRSVHARRGESPLHDEGFCGFRSCAI